MTETKSVFLIRGLTADGIAMFYTGRTGDGWVSYDPFAAFHYERRESAQRKALTFNRMTELHGFRFTAFEVEA